LLLHDQVAVTKSHISLKTEPTNYLIGTMVNGQDSLESATS